MRTPAIAVDHPVWEVVTAALGLVTDVTPLVPHFLSAWDATVLDRTLPDHAEEALARHPLIEARLRADLAASTTSPDAELVVHRRAQMAGHYLGKAGTATALIALIEATREVRSRSVTREQRKFTVQGILAGLNIARVPAIVPTLMLAAIGADLATTQGFEALFTLATVAPERIGPVLTLLANATELVPEVIEALILAARVTRDPSHIAALRTLCAAPVSESLDASEALGDLGYESPATTPVPEPESLLGHPSEFVRARAIRILDERADPTLTAAMLAADALQSELSREGGRARPELLRAVREQWRWQPLAEQLAWAMSSEASGLPPQTIAPLLATVLARGFAATVADYPRTWPFLSPSCRAALFAEESAILAGLRGARLAPDGDTFAIAPPAELELVPEALAGSTDSTTEQVDAALTALAQPLPFARERALRSELLAMPPGLVTRRLLAHSALARGELVRLANEVLPRAVADPDLARIVAATWADRVERSADDAVHVTELFESVATDDLLFAEALDALGAPDDDALRYRTTAAIDLLGWAARRREAATAVLVALLRRTRGHRVDGVRWRSRVLQALIRLDSPSALPTALLECAEHANFDNLSDYIRLLQKQGTEGRHALLRVLELPHASEAAVQELCRTSTAARAGYLAHPYYKLQLAAASTHDELARTRAESLSIHAALEALGIPIREVDRRRARPSDSDPAMGWADLAQPHGGLVPVPTPGDPRLGFAARCADHRAWALWAADERTDPVDLPARIFADELDRVLAERGGIRTGARWGRWRSAVPALPRDRAGRLAWARAVSADLDPVLALVRDEGATAVAATYPGAVLKLDADTRLRYERAEASVVELGNALLSGGLAARARFDEVPDRRPAPVPAPFF